MVDEAILTLEKGIEEMKHFQLSTCHQMADDLVDGVINILTSLNTLLLQFQDFTLTYADVTVRYSGLYFTQECLLLRSLLTDIVDYNENITTLLGKSWNLQLFEVTMNYKALPCISSGIENKKIKKEWVKGMELEKQIREKYYRG